MRASYHFSTPKSRKKVDLRLETRYDVPMQKLIQLYLTIYRFWMRQPEKIRFVLVGGYNAVVSYALYAWIVWLSNEQQPQLALFLSYLITTINSFLTQKFFVFGTFGKLRDYWNEYVKCCCTWVMSYGLNVILLFLFLDVIKMNVYVGQIVATALVAVNSYLFLKHFAFKGKKHD